MKFSGYVLMLFAISLMFYLAGYTPIVDLMNSKNTLVQPAPSNCDAVDLISNPSACTTAENSILGNLLIILGAGAVVLLVLFSGYSAVFIIPALLLFVILQYFIFPLSFIMQTDMPPIVAIPIIIFFNIITVLAFSSFIRGEI